MNQDEAAHVEPPHQDLCCLRIRLLSIVSSTSSVIESVDAEELLNTFALNCFAYVMRLFYS